MKKFILILTAALIWAFPFLGTAGVLICVVKSHDFPIYGEVLAGFWQALELAPSGCEVVLMGNEGEAEKKIQQESPSMIVALGNSSVEFLKAKFPKIPVVFAMANEPEKLVTNFSGTSLSGVSIDVPLGTQLDLLKTAIPDLKRVGSLYSTRSVNINEELKAQAQLRGISVNSHAVNTPDESIKVLSELKNEQLFWLLPDRDVISAKTKGELMKGAKDLNLMVYAFSPTYMVGINSADISVSIDFREHGRQLGDLTKRTMANPSASLAVEKPKKVRLYLKEGRFKKTSQLSEAVWIP